MSNCIAPGCLALAKYDRMCQQHDEERTRQRGQHAMTTINALDSELAALRALADALDRYLASGMDRRNAPWAQVLACRDKLATVRNRE
jgi:hypothetical protein